jgi:hypothetical protein
MQQSLKCNLHNYLQLKGYIPLTSVNTLHLGSDKINTA